MGNISHRGLTFIVIVGMITGMYLPNTIDTVMGDSSIIYVDDDNTEGPWKGTKEYPYKKIQDGINQSAEGDTVFVYNGLYKENVRIYTSDIIVTGEDKYSTIIDGNQNWYTLKIENNIDKRIKNIVLTNFTIKNASYDGIYVRFADEIIIRNSIIIDNSNCGLHIEYSDGSIYEYNIFRNNSWWDFYMEFSLFCEIRYNAFLYTRTGVRTETCSNNEFYSNEFRGHNHYGIHLVRDCYLQPRNKIHHNNFFDNCVDARFQDCKNVWYHNYWNCSHIVHVIWGGRYLILSSKASIFLPMWEFDLFPVDEHYDIVV